MRVLLIDDDALVRLLLMDTLAAEGIEVDGLANAEDALTSCWAPVRCPTCWWPTSTSGRA